MSTIGERHNSESAHDFKERQTPCTAYTKASIPNTVAVTIVKVPQNDMTYEKVLTSLYTDTAMPRVAPHIPIKKDFDSVLYTCVRIYTCHSHRRWYRPHHLRVLFPDLQKPARCVSRHTCYDTVAVRSFENAAFYQLSKVVSSESS